jgi:tetraacyldisaccharide 4'-kinase
MTVFTGKSPTWRWLFFLPGLLFAAVVRARNRLYDAGIAPQLTLPHPVVSVGNLTLGGSGKTPLVALIAQTVARSGGTPALLSRGYGRVHRAPVILPPEPAFPTAVQLIGDEPALLRRHEPRLWLGICRDRHEAGQKIALRAPRLVFILDDGFQHRRLKRDLDIVVVDRTQPLEHNRTLPAGTLREPLAGLRRAGLIVINGLLSIPDDPLESHIRKINPDARIFHCLQRIERVVSLAGWKEGGADSKPCIDIPPGYLVAAVGNPERLRRDVLAFGIRLKGARYYRDHFSPRKSDWQSCAGDARSRGAEVLIVTEKDAIKIAHDFDMPVLVAVQSTRLVEQIELERILTSLRERAE